MKNKIVQYYINARATRFEIPENTFNDLFHQMETTTIEKKDFTIKPYTKKITYKDGVCTLTTFTLIDACGYSYFELIKVMRQYF